MVHQSKSQIGQRRSSACSGSDNSRRAITVHSAKPTNPTRGSLGVAEQSRGCSMTTGWFAVDNVAYASGTITALELRFEQHCEDMTPALHGAIRFAGP